MSTGAAIVIGLIIYVVLTTGVSFFWMTRVRKPADYLVAGRGLPLWVLLGTIVGTCIGTGVIIGGSGLAYQHGWAGCAYPIGLGLGTLFVGQFYARTRRYKFMTLIEEISCYYEGNRLVAEFSNITLFLSQLCWVTVQIMGAAAVVGAATGYPRATCVILSGAAKAIISIPGGLKAVVYTDVLQTIILFGGFGCLLHTTLHGAGGLEGLRAAVPPDYFSLLGIASIGGWKLVSLILVMILSVIADPNRRLTIYSAHSEASAKWSMVASGAIVVVFSAAIGITGMYTFKLNPHLAVPDQALPWLVMNVLPPWLAAFMVVAVVSGISSAANGTAAAAATFFVRHIFHLVTGRYPKHPVSMARLALACVFAVSTTMALYTGSIVGFVVKFLPVTMSGLAVIIVLGRFWRRSTWQGAVAALLVTPVASLSLMNYMDNPVLPATLTGALALVVASLATSPPRRGFDEVAESMSRERQEIEGPATHQLQAAPLSAVKTI